MRLIVYVHTPRGWHWSGPFDTMEAARVDADKWRGLYPFREVLIKDTPLAV